MAREQRGSGAAVSALAWKRLQGVLWARSGVWRELLRAWRLVCACSRASQRLCRVPSRKERVSPEVILSFLALLSDCKLLTVALAARGEQRRHEIESSVSSVVSPDIFYLSFCRQPLRLSKTGADFFFFCFFFPTM